MDGLAERTDELSEDVMGHTCKAGSFDGMTPIYLACYWQRWSAAELLIKAGTPVNMLVADTYSALYFAAKYENCDTVDLLVDAGADPSLGLEPTGSCSLEGSEGSEGSEGQGEGDCCSTVTLKADGEAASLYASYLGTVRHHS